MKLVPIYALLWLAGLITLAVMPVRAAQDEPRHALVIGNANYTWSPLANPINDAQDMAKSLRRLGFEVTALIDADLRQMRRAAIDFGRKLGKTGGVGLFYYAGHGMQVDGENYLIPLNAIIEVEDHVPVEALSVNQILARMGGAKNRMNIVILDACRNNPVGSATRSGSRGLAQTDAPFGTYISFATAPGQVAADGAGRNGLYTGALLDALEEPGLQIEETFKRVRSTVVSSTDNRQIPWSSSSIVGNFVFNEEADTIDLDFSNDDTDTASIAPTAPTQPVIDPREQALWRAVSDGGSEADYRSYLRSYPDGLYSDLANSRLLSLQTAEESRPEINQDVAGLGIKKQPAAPAQKQQASPSPVPEQTGHINLTGNTAEDLFSQYQSYASVPETPAPISLSKVDGSFVYALVREYRFGKAKDKPLTPAVWQGLWANFRGENKRSEFKIKVQGDTIWAEGFLLDEGWREGVQGILTRKGPNLFTGPLDRIGRAGGPQRAMLVKIITPDQM